MQSFDFDGIGQALTRAAFDQTQWPRALDEVTRSTGSFGAVLLPITGSLPIFSSTSSLAETTDIYVKQGWVNRDQRYRGKNKLLATGIITDDDCLPVEERKTSSFYQDFVFRCGLRGFAGIRVGRGNHVWSLNLQRSKAQDMFSTKELIGLSKFSQRLDTIAEIATTFELARAYTALDVFQIANRAALLLNRSGKVVRVNQSAEELIRRGDLQVAKGKVRSRNARATEVLSRAIGSILNDISISAPVVLPKEDGGKLIVYLSRLDVLKDNPISAYHAVLFIADTTKREGPALSTLRSVFDFTSAEARLVAALAKGEDISSYSTANALSTDTARSHLKSIFAKTGTSRQASLVAMLSGLISGL